MNHILKTEPMMWFAIMDGAKTAEFRKDDRGFSVGDSLLLKPGTDTRDNSPTIDVKVTHIVRGPSFGIPEGFVMMSFSVNEISGFRE